MGNYIRALMHNAVDRLRIVRFYYDEKNNVMMDENGFVMHDIYRYVSPTDILVFKNQNNNMMLDGRSGDVVELVYSLD